MVLSENPSSQMIASAPSSETGMARVGTSAARQLPRNASTTSTTSPTASISVFSASPRVARITGERSITTSMSTPAGSSARSWSIWAWIASTVSMMLALGWRLITSSTASRSLWKPAA